MLTVAIAASIVWFSFYATKQLKTSIVYFKALVTGHLASVAAVRAERKSKQRRAKKAASMRMLRERRRSSLGDEAKRDIQQAVERQQGLNAKPAKVARTATVANMMVHVKQTLKSARDLVKRK